jgi:hypothetical protein
MHCIVAKLPSETVVEVKPVLTVVFRASTIRAVIATHEAGCDSAAFFLKGCMNKPHDLGRISVNQDNIWFIIGTADQSDEDVLIPAKFELRDSSLCSFSCLFWFVPVYISSQRFPSERKGSTSSNPKLAWVSGQEGSSFPRAKVHPILLDIPTAWQIANLFWKSFIGLLVFSGTCFSEVRSLMASGRVVSLI